MMCHLNQEQQHQQQQKPKEMKNPTSKQAWLSELSLLFVKSIKEVMTVALSLSKARKSCDSHIDNRGSELTRGS